MRYVGFTRGSLIIYALVLASFAARADGPESNREIAQTLSAYFIENEKLDEAHAFLTDHLSRDPRDADAWRLYGLVASRRKDWFFSTEAFRKAASLTEGVEKGTNLYLLADAQARAGSVASSLKTIREMEEIPGFASPADDASLAARASTPFPALRMDKVMAARAALAQAERGQALKLSATLTSGYDTNVLLLPDASSGPAPGSAFVTPSIEAIHGGRLFDSPLSAYLIAGYTINTSSAATSFNSLPVGQGAEWLLPGALGRRHLISVTEQFDLAFVNSSGLNLFTLGGGLGLKKRIPVAPGRQLELTLPVSYRIYPGVAVADPRDDRVGLGLAPAAVFRHPLGSFTLMEFAGYQRQFTRGENFHSNAFTFLVNAQRELRGGWVAQGVSGVTYTSYPDSARGRRDTRLSAGLEAGRAFRLGAPVNASAAYGYERSFSNVTSAAYSKHSIALKVTYAIR